MNRDPHLPLPTEPFTPRTTSRPPSRQSLAATQTQPVEQGADRPLAATEPAPAVLPAELLQDDAGHTLELSQLEALSALMEAELRKSDPLAATVPVESSPPPAPSATSDEESLQTYLDRFMERVTGKKPDGVPPPAVQSHAPVTRPVPAQPIASQPIASQPISSPTIPPISQPIIRPSQPIAGAAPPPSAPPQTREPVRAPERPEQMAAMRDLANENLRTAMNAHADRQWRRTKAAFLLATAATTISSMLAIWNLLAAAPGTAESAACTGLIAVYLACRFYWRSRSLAALI
jgi:hypothetical protein